jgi:hypothetical protein
MNESSTTSLSIPSLVISPPSSTPKMTSGKTGKTTSSKASSSSSKTIVSKLSSASSSSKSKSSLASSSSSKSSLSGDKTVTKSKVAAPKIMTDQG